MTAPITKKVLSTLRRAAIKASTTPNWGDDGDDNFTEEWIPDVALALLDMLEAKDATIAFQQREIRTLLDNLDKAHRANAAQDDHINQQADRIESLEKKNGELGQAYYDRLREIAELQSRAESAEQALLLERKKMLVIPPAVSVGGQGYRDQIIELCAAAGITLQIQGDE